MSGRHELPRIEIGLLSSIEDGGVRVVEVAGERVAVFNCRGALLAVGDRCSHAQASLAQGSVDRVRCTVECPLHSAEFDLRSGAPLSPPAREAVPCYRVVVTGDRAFIEVDEIGVGPAGDGPLNS